ncbi:hypothetical protein BDV25DRAFT_151931 [Aspergillus avenaceus]|uniref:Uncharacterized protein n=1 Tax=Aspergillus avenaceus TaxID=36643 RepID=A0A5N6TZX2_ASPAV|nr:hypothetical protein BDV25DRAFT_151931 [Aspergillus avenaceus]
MSDKIEKLDRAMSEALAALQAHPSATHPTVFYVFDFVRNSHNKLKAIDANKLQAGDRAAKEEMSDIVGRNALAEGLCSGEGPMAQMMAMMGGGSVDFGPEVREKLRAVTDA